MGGAFFLGDGRVEKQKVKRSPKRKHTFNRMENISGWMFILVAMVVFAVFTLYPVISAVIRSINLLAQNGLESGIMQMHLAVHCSGNPLKIRYCIQWQ